MTGALFHPESNSCTELAVKTIKNIFEKYSNAQSKLNKNNLMYRNTPHLTTRESPSQLVLGRTTSLQFEALI